MTVELLSHHVKNIQRVIEESLSPEQMIMRMETEFPQYQTPVIAEREAYVEAHRQAFGAIQRGDYKEIDDRSELASDMICRACSPTSDAAKSCQRKEMAQSFLNLKETLGGRNPTQKEVIDAYMGVFNEFLQIELRRRGFVSESITTPH